MFCNLKVDSKERRWASEIPEEIIAVSSWTFFMGCGVFVSCLAA